MLDYKEISIPVITKDLTKKSNELLKRQYQEYCQNKSNPINFTKWLIGFEDSIFKYIK